MGNPESGCFHCGEAIPAGSGYHLELDGIRHSMCCAGCLGVAQLIHDSGYQRYYRFRQAQSRRAGDDLVQLQAAWRSADAKRAFWGYEEEPGVYSLLLQTEGIVCAACAWLIQSELTREPGVDEVQVDIASGLTRLRWRPAHTRLSAIALRLLSIGYKPHLPLFEEEERGRQREHIASLKRLGIAGLGMMQVMMYAVALYAGEAQGIGEAAKRFLEWVSLLVTTPVLLYSGRVFILSAWRSLRTRRPGMDVPVAVAIVAAYIASCLNFFSGSGEVWFDSIVMFIFFLSLARHVEMRIRHRNQQSGAALARLLPEWCERITPDGAETVPATELQPGDLVRVRPGDSFPADGVVLEGQTEVNEALLTGESHPLPRYPGERLAAGSINLTQPVLMQVQTVGSDSTVSALGRLLQRARTERRSYLGLAERYASAFVIAVLTIAALTGAWWIVFDGGRALGITLSVLVVSCPCAFSLASPTVIAAASRVLLKNGIVLTRGGALERLAAVTHVLFDKTGTLTSGEPQIRRTTQNAARTEYAREQLLSMAAALERASSHPVARAFREHDSGLELGQASSTPGGGMSGRIGQGVFRIGTRAFALGAAAAGPEGDEEGIWLADNNGWLIRFELTDQLRTGAATLVRRFSDEGLKMSILSGDRESAVTQVAERLGIADFHSRMGPEDKLNQLKGLNEAGFTTLMIGDGVNDAPVLAAASASVSVKGGSELANSAADFVLTGHSLELIAQARDIAIQAGRLVKQNLLWAAGYNFTMIPLAVSGHLQPWMAALGMSASSLLVVLNASRITHRKYALTSSDIVYLT